MADQEVTLQPLIRAAGELQERLEQELDEMRQEETAWRLGSLANRDPSCPGGQSE